MKTVANNKRHKGSALLVVLGISVSIVIASSAIMQLLPAFKKKVMETEDVMNLNLFLDSAVDYAVVGIKNRWCFDENMGNDLNQCNLSHVRNTERLLLLPGSDSFRFLQQVTPGMADPSLKSIEQTVPLQKIISMSSQHPLYKIASTLPQGLVTGIKFIISRENNVNYPAGSESEIYIKVYAEAQTLGPLGLFSNRFRKAQYWSHTVLSIHPRELNTMGLILAGDLKLDIPDNCGNAYKPSLNAYNPMQGGSASYNPGQKDACIPNISKSSRKSYTGGLRFLSPVYVNGNIVLPDEAGERFSPVYFQDAVILGGGTLKIGTEDYEPAPRSALYSEMTSIGGFLNGIRMDGISDLGLDYMRNSSSNVTDEDLMKKCIKHTNAIYNLKTTKDSSLVVKKDSATADTQLYKIGFDGYDMFYDQDIAPGSLQNVVPGNWDVQFTQADASLKKSVLTVTVNINDDSIDQKIAFNMDRNSSFTIKINDPTLLSSSPAEVLAEASIISITTSPVIMNSKTEPHLLNLSVKVTNPGGILKKAHPPVITVAGFDVGYDGNAHLIRAGETLGSGKTAGQLAYQIADDGAVVLPNISSVNYVQLNIPTIMALSQDDLTEDLAKLIIDCAAGAKEGFPVAGWDSSFTSGSENSWHFADTQVVDPRDHVLKIPDPGTTGFTSADGGDTADKAVFSVKSLMGTCVISGTTNLFTGFLGCRSLIIAARPIDKPLTIIGSILVTRSMSVDKSALDAGITWSNIYTPAALKKLREVALLKTGGADACSNLPPDNAPIWHPQLGFTDLSKYLKCSPLSLRNKADPFKWTQVDPDCGILPGQTTTSCKHHMTKFSFAELYRESSSKGLGQ